MCLAVGTGPRPQKIHMATGTLADQVTYPSRIEPSDRTPAVEARLQELLDLVGVGYLVTRWAGDAAGRKRAEHKGWDHETKWDEVLSLGEQQRIGMSRLFYHRAPPLRQPAFMITNCLLGVTLDCQTSNLREVAMLAQSQSLECWTNALRRCRSTWRSGCTAAPRLPGSRRSR